MIPFKDQNNLRLTKKKNEISKKMGFFSCFGKRAKKNNNTMTAITEPSPPAYEEVTTTNLSEEVNTTNLSDESSSNYLSIPPTGYGDFAPAFIIPSLLNNTFQEYDPKTKTLRECDSQDKSFTNFFL